MAGPLDQEYDSLVKSLNESNYTKEESLQILSEHIKALLSNECITSDRRWAASMITVNFIKRVRICEWKFPHGFFGNWAKHHEEEFSQLDVSDSGC